jgi:putative ABC transport system ATP-binding protein
MPLLEGRDLAMTFTEGRRSVPVLHGISLTVDAGEVVVLEGPSGSGKTTLLSILGCLLTPTAGEVRFGGLAVDGRSEDAKATVRRRWIGFVFQQFNLLAPLTARENVEYALHLKGTRGRAARAEAERWLDLVGLADRRDFLPADLSGGQQQRVAIARALAGGTPAILADEPTANLDTRTGAQVLDLFRCLARDSRRALLVVSHDPSIRRLADRVLFIRDGRLTATDPTPPAPLPC